MRARPRLGVFVLVALILAASTALSSQEGPKILRVAAFGGDGILPGEAVALQNLITSYVIELKLFRVIDEGGQELALKEAETAMQLGVAKDVAPLAADYVLSGQASKLGSFIVFTMDVTKVSSGEKKSVADAFSSVNDLILAARRLTSSLFDKQAAPQAGTSPSPSGRGDQTAQQTARPVAPQIPAGSNPSPNLSLVAGTWKGDKNVDRVSILPDGRGFAVLASGVRMAVKASIEGGTVVIVQNQANSPDFYRPGLNLKSAKIVSDGARPWRWVFSLSSDGGSLVGVKESVFVSVNDKGAVSIDNSYVRDAAWKKLYR